MNTEDIFLLDGTGRCLGKVSITQSCNGLYQGKFIPIDFPEELKKVFRDYEELVNNQVYPLLDDIEEQIEGWSIVLSNQVAKPKDIQLMNENQISFRLE
jgi:hypothetical protein